MPLGAEINHAADTVWQKPDPEKQELKIESLL